MKNGSGKGFTEIGGKIIDLIYINPDNGFTVVEFQPSDDSESFRASGVMPDLFPGEFVTLTGRMEIHPVYGETFRVSCCTKSIPSDSESMILFLSCGLFHGVGEVTARSIVEKFGDDTADVILYDPERLAEVKKISKNRAAAIAETFREYFNVSETLKFFADMDISTRIALSVYDRFGVNSIAVTKRNPYHLIDEVPQIGFKTADQIAIGLGVNQNSGSRICAFIKYYLQSQLNYGNVCFPRKLLVDSVSFELSVDPEIVAEALDSLLKSGALQKYHRSDPEDLDEYIFIGFISECEEYVARRMKRLLSGPIKQTGAAFEKFIDRFDLESGFELNDIQIAAVKSAVENPFCIITGGPGTGKTTIIKALYQYLSSDGVKCTLCAPTGRAAKRMSEAVGVEAKTIHRLLEYSAFTKDDGTDGGYDDESRLKFNRNENNPLETDVLIVDESSMLDTLLAYHLLKALKEGARLVMLGDKDQLPSVGPGNILKDIISSGLFPVTTLTYVYRQSDTSLIAYNAQRINMGLMPEMNRRDKDFFMLDCEDPAMAPELLNDVVNRRLPARYGIDPMRDIQVIIPGKKGECGVENINLMLQDSLNPDSADRSRQPQGTLSRFRKGDRVMQIKNNYEIEWYSRKVRGQSGKGIFNGEMGVIEDIDAADRTIEVLFDDDRVAEYGFDLLPQLELCYAITVHKSQGSEFEYCIILLSNIPPRLCTRNILYTAVTRARKMLVMIGDRRYLRAMVENDTEEKRYTCLADRLTTQAEGILF